MVRAYGLLLNEPLPASFLFISTVHSQYVHCEILPVYEPRTSGIEGNRSANDATTASLD